MLSKKDEAIQENLLKKHVVETFNNHIYIRKEDHAIVADSLAEFLKTATDPCHIWQGAIDYKGYGAFSVYSKKFTACITVKAHRFAYALEYGFDELPIGIEGGDGTQLVINHICHNRRCVNPKHLESITDSENTSHEKRKPLNV